ncbi:MAG: hypothetical protein ACFFE2_00360 [Candidatus Thorarchaeota archaeon]
MYTTKLFTKVFSLAVLALFSLSLFMTPPIADISTEESLTAPISYSRYNPYSIADYPENYTRVDWDLGTVNEENTHNWSSSHYRFGPTINWHTRNTTDSTLITWNDEIAINEYVDFRIEIPYSSLGGQTPFGVYLMGQYFNMSALANSEGQFYMSGNSPIMFMVWYNISGGNWLTFSSTNTTWPEAPPAELPPGFALSDVFGTEVSPFMEMNMAASGYVAGAESYWANVRLRFNSSTIGGFYTISCGVQDTQLQTIAESRFEEFNSGRIIGTTFDFLVDQAVGGYYDWERVSDDGFPLYSATRGVDFNMTATITNGTNLSTATVLFEIPNQIRTKNWVYGPYTVTEEVTGVWEFDDVSETYFWNATKTVNWTSQKEGFHYEDGYTWLDTGREYNFNDYGFIQTRWTSGQAAIVYNFTTGTFTTVLAYHYDNMTEVTDQYGTHWEKINWFEYEPWPVDGSIPLPYIVNQTTSESYWANGKLVVTFRGHISDNIRPTTQDDGNWPLNVWEIITDIHGRGLAPAARLPLSSPEDAAQYDLLNSLAVESPVSIVTLTHGGEPYEPDWMFYSDIGVPFTVKSWLQGGADYINEIDGIGFFMTAYEDNRGFDGMFDWHQWSEIEIQIRIDPHGAVDVAVYNRTVRNQWINGTYWDWVMVEVMPGRWEPQWKLIDDWHWEELTWDFVADDWTSGWLSFESPNLRMPVHWLDVAGLMIDPLGNDLRISFDIIPTPELPQLEWRWKYFYGDLTWVIDYESGWGEHTVLGWNENTVYSYINGTSKLYMDEPVKAEIFKDQITPDLYQRDKIPYVVINGQEINLDKYLMTDMEYNWEETVRSEYNYLTGEEEYFIKFANGTEIQVYSGSAGVIFNITLPNLGNANFLAWGDGPQYAGIDDLYYMLAVNGTMIIQPWFIWDLWIAQFYEVVEVSQVEYTYVTYLNGTKPFYMRGWPEYLGYDHYVMYRNETYEPVEFWYDPTFGYHYWNMTDGKLYMFDWPWELMTGVYNSQPFFIPQFMTRSHVYTVVSGKEFQLPAPGIPMWSPWELNDLENIINPATGRYFAKEYAIVDGVPYEAIKLPMQEWEPIFGYWYDIYQIDTGVIRNLTDWSMNPAGRFNYDVGDYMKNLPWTTVANGTIWVPTVAQEDWTVAVGHRDTQTYEFVADGWLDLQTGYYDGDYQTSMISDWNTTGGYDYVLTMSGEKFFYNETWRATFLNISLSNGTFFYSRMDNPVAEPIDITQPEIDRYFMIDIYGNYQGWRGWMDFTAQLVFVEDVLGDPFPGSGSFFWNGTYQPIIQYPVDYWEWDGSMWFNRTFIEDNIVPHYYNFLQSALNGSMYEIVSLQQIPESYKFNFPSWAFNVSGTEYHAFGAKELLYQAFKTQGYSRKLDYAPLPISIVRSQEVIVYGVPAYGMWDHEVWTIDPLTGALDLDGDLSTTVDQFYVKEIHSSTDYFNITQQYLDVSILWEPDNTTYADEFYLHSYTGMVTFNWTYDWSELNIWTHADTGATLTSGEYATIYNVLFDSYGNPQPGYWGIAWMFENRTYADVINQAKDEGWDWVEDNSQEWSWLWWELDEQYSTVVSNGTHSDLMDINLAYQYAGMFAWNDTNSDNFMDISSESLGDAELTHYWMPINVESVSFTTPGEAWGNLNTTDSEYRSVDETIDFGVTFNNVTGEVYPFGVRSYFDWYEDAYYGSDFVDFDERPTECLTEEFSIDVHFTGAVNQTDDSGIAEVKFDITVGDWEMYTPGGDDALDGRSLAVSFYSDITILTSGGMTANATYIDDLGQTVTNDQAAASYNFTMASGLSDVALMSLGGSPYTWTKNTSMPVTVDAQTIPVDAFSAIYVSGGGHSATTFSVASTQFYTVIGFPQWDGWAVTVDPIFVGYISPGTPDSEAPSFGTTIHSAVQITGVDNVHIEASVTDGGGSGLAGVKVWDIDNNINHTMTYDEGRSVWEVDIARTIDGRYNFNYRIVAEDNAGNEATTTIQSFLFRDNLPPTIDSLNIVNGTDIYGDEIATVTATASDTGGSGIDYVVLSYWNTTGVYNITMAYSAGEYSGEIPNHAPGTIVQYGITVYDIDGNLDWSGWDTFTFATGGAPDTVSPSITLVFHDPASPASTDAVTVSADIQDVSGVASAVLQYKVDGGAWNNVTMTSVGTTYSATIPSQADGVTVTYRIVAYDTVGNEAVSGEFSYNVEDVATTTIPTGPTTTETPTSPTEPTGPPGPGPGDQETLLMVYGAFGALVVIVLALAARRRK